MDIYYQSDKFKQLLRRYEDLQENISSEFLDPEELTDIAEFFHYMGDDQEAMEAIDMAIKIDPLAVIPRTFKARMALLCDKDPQLANKIAETIIDKNDPDYEYLKAEIMIVDNKVAAADSFLKNVYDDIIDPEERAGMALDVAALFSDYEEMEYAETWLNRSNKTEENDYKEIRAHILKSRGEYKESELILNELLDSNPYSGPYWNQLAQSQLLRNDINEAITSSEYSIAINPEDEEAILNKANGLFALGNYEEALKYFERYKKLSHEQDKSLVDISIGHIYLSQRDIHNAQQHFQMALEEAPDKNMAIIQVGCSSFDNGYIEYAYHLFSTLLPSLGDDWDIGYGFLARCCYELKKKREFKKYLRQAVEKNPEECIDVLSDLYPEGTNPQDYPSFNIL